MARQSWIARRRVENTDSPAHEWHPAARLISIKIIDQIRECEFMRTEWNGLVLVHVAGAGWPEVLRVTDQYTLTHEQSAQKIAVFDDVCHYERFATDPQVKRLMEKIKWYKTGDDVIAQMKPHLDTFKRLREKHGCTP